MGDFAGRMKQCRLDAGLKQSVAAKLSGISQQAISFYETGKRIPHADAIIALARTYDVSIDYLLGVTDEREPFYRGA